MFARNSTVTVQACNGNNNIAVSPREKERERASCEGTPSCIEENLSRVKSHMHAVGHRTAQIVEESPPQLSALVVSAETVYVRSVDLNHYTL